MKKVSIITAVCVLLLLLSGCSLMTNIDNPPAPDLPAKESVSNPSDKKEKTPRTVDISAGITDGGYGYSYAYDFDFDGEKETISMKVIDDVDNEWFSSLDVSIGEYQKYLELLDGIIEKVYVCDIDPDDGVMNLAIITCEISGDPRIRILQYDPELAPCMFKAVNPDGEYMEDSLWLGYAVSYYFNVNEDDSITIETQTDSAGMWSVYKTYRENDGFFVEDIPETYKVLPDFMERAISGETSLSGEELAKWKEGYVKACVEYAGDGITLAPGDYFKVTLDDGNNNLYIKKESGEAGWINVDYKNEARYQLNGLFFFLAG